MFSEQKLKSLMVDVGSNKDFSPGSLFKCTRETMVWLQNSAGNPLRTIYRNQLVLFVRCTDIIGNIALVMVDNQSCINYNYMLEDFELVEQ